MEYNKYFNLKTTQKHETMKLSNIQLNYIVDLVYNKLNDSKDDYDKLLSLEKKNPKNLTDAKLIHLAIKKIPRDFINYNGSNFRIILDRICRNNLKKRKFKKEITRNEIRGKIILKSIESKTLKELTKQFGI